MINCPFTYRKYNHRKQCCHDIAFRHRAFQIFFFPCSIKLSYQNSEHRAAVGMRRAESHADGRRIRRQFRRKRAIAGNKSKTDGKAADNTAGGDATTKNHADDANSTTSSKQDTGNYADGDYSINGQYGPVGEDTIDVHLTVKDQNVTAVKIVGHPFTSISKKHQNDFAKAVPDAVVGKPLKDLKVDKLAGASWTSEAFNKALEVARQEASIQ